MMPRGADAWAQLTYVLLLSWRYVVRLHSPSRCRSCVEDYMHVTVRVVHEEGVENMLVLASTLTKKHSFPGEVF